MSCNKAAIVTGAGQGIGKAIAMALAQKGAAVMAADLNGETAKGVCEEIKKNGGEADFIKTDVSSVASLSEMVEKTAKAFGGVDILVNNAGIMHTTPIHDITEDEWDKIMNVNLKSVFFALQKALPFMQKRGGGKIINISSLGRAHGWN